MPQDQAVNNVPVQSPVPQVAPVVEQAPPAPIDPTPPTPLTPAHRAAPRRSQTQELDPNQVTDFQGNRLDTNQSRQEARVVVPGTAPVLTGTAVVPPPNAPVTISPTATSYAAKPPHHQPPVADEKGNWFQSLLAKLEHFGEVEMALLKAKIAQLEGKNTKDPVKP